MTPATKTGVTDGRVQSPVDGSKLSRSAAKQKAASSRVKSRVNDGDRLLSSRFSTENGTKYPSLSDNRAEEQRQRSEAGLLPPLTPGRSRSQGVHGHSRVPSKASTLAPSDSPSVAGPKYYQKRAARLEQEVQEKEQVAAARIKSHKNQGQPVPNPMSPKSPTVRVMSPRQQVTPEDSMQAADITDPTTHEGSVGDEVVRVDREDDEQHQYRQQEVSAHTRGLADEYVVGAGNDSPRHQFLEEELYKLRVKPGPGTHKTWEVVREGGDYEYEDEAQAAVTESGMPEISDATIRQGSLPPPPTSQSDTGGEMALMSDLHSTHQGYNSEIQTPPWELIHQRLLNWAVIWPMSELDAALRSTTRGHQVDKISLSIWATQVYKRYVRSRMTDSPQGRVDQVFVPPDVADAISMAVFNGRYWDACIILRDLWGPFGLDGIPRLVITLAKHRSDENHWVVHRCARESSTSISLTS